MRRNNVENYEPLMVYLDPVLNKLSYKQKLSELLGSGMSEQEAKDVIACGIELELYYSPNLGLFAVESEIIDCSVSVWNPYTGKEMEDFA